MQVQTVDYQDPNAAKQLTDSLKFTGFAVLKNPPIPKELIQDIYAEWKEFYNSEAKHDYLYDKEKLDGYYPFRTENAKGYDKKNLMEFYHLYTWGKYPTQVSDNAMILVKELNKLALELLTWIDSQLPEEVKSKFSMPLSDMVNGSERSVMRMIYYPPLDGSEEAGAIRAYDHEDINLITLLPASTTSGLQVKDSNGNWHKIQCDEGNITINAGDILQMLTNHYLISTTHRVVNPEGEMMKKSRMSMPLFVHPHDEVKLSDEHTGLSYLLERMRENSII